MFHFIQNIVKSISPFTQLQVSFDLGTHTTKIGLKGKGVVLREPTCAALRIQPTKEYLFFGSDAKQILGKTPEFLQIIKPIVNGIVSDFDTEVALLRFYIDKAITPYTQSMFIKPPIHAITAVPTIATEIEQKAVEEALLKAGCSFVSMIKKPLATASGAGFNVFFHKPHLVVDIGAGMTEISVISGGGIVNYKALKQAGDYMDRVIANYIHLKHGVVLGEATCEKLKISCLNFSGAEVTELARGKSLENGLPKSVKIRSSELREALTPTYTLIIDTIKELIEMSPPEVVNDIYQEGILLTGKAALIPGFATFIGDELKIEVVVPEHAAEATIYGLLKIADAPTHLKSVRINTA
jgi:rod shape-determining protein MreB